MPAKNSVKPYIQNGYYHIYNRGVEKRKIFLDKQDYSVFLSYLKTYLMPKDINDMQERLSNPEIGWKERDSFLRLIRLNNFHDEISLLAYCLMPNHFHLLIKQTSSTAIDTFINSLCTRYVMFFNKKYKRVGSLYQDVYKAVLVKRDEQLLHLSAYIHRNPIKITYKQNLKINLLSGLLKKPSSLPEYLGLRKTIWVETSEILSFFSKSHIQQHQKYKEFILKSIAPDETIHDLLIEKIRV